MSKDLLNMRGRKKNRNQTGTEYNFVFFCWNEIHEFTTRDAWHLATVKSEVRLSFLASL